MNHSRQNKWQSQLQTSGFVKLGRGQEDFYKIQTILLINYIFYVHRLEGLGYHQA